MTEGNDQLEAEDPNESKGFGGALELDKTGWKTLIVLGLMGLVCTVWVAWNAYTWSERKELKAATIAFAEGRIQLANERFASVDARAVDNNGYIAMKVDLLSVSDPDAAIRTIIDEVDFTKGESPTLSLRQQLILNLGLRLCARQESLPDLNALLEIAEQNGLGDTPNVLVAKSWKAIQAKDSKAAIELLRDALKENPYHQEAILLRSQIQLISSNLLERNSAMVSLRDIGSNKDALGLEALILLILDSKGMLKGTDLERATAQLKSHPYLDFYYKLNQLNVLRSFAQRYYSVDPQFALYFSDRIIARENSTASDWTQRAGIALKLNDEALVLQAVEKSKESGVDQRVLRILETRQLYMNQEFEKSLNLSLEFINSDATAEEKDLFYAGLIDFLKNDRVDHSLKSKAVAPLLTWNGAQIDSWLLIRHLAWSYWPDRRAELTQSVKTNSTFEYRLLLSNFLLTHGKPAEAIELLDSYEETASLDTFDVRFAALLSLDRLGLAAEVVESMKGLGRFQRAFAQLRLGIRSEKNEKDLNTLWTQVENAIDERNQQSQYAVLGRFALSVDAWSNGSKYLRRWFELADASQVVATEGATGSAYLRYLLVEGETRKARDVMGLLATWDPENFEFVFGKAYLDLLLAERTLQAKDSMKALFDQDDTNLAYRIGWAFSNMKTGQVERSLEILEGAASNDGKIYPVLQYAILSENGYYERAQPLLNNIEIETLLPEEQAIIIRYKPSGTE